MRHQQPCRRPLRPESERGLLWPSGRGLCSVHASSMVESTADDHLTVDGDRVTPMFAQALKQKVSQVSAVSLGVTLCFMDTA